MSYKSFNQSQLEQISRILGDCVTGSQITVLLEQCNLNIGETNNTKWRRIYNAFVEYQNKFQSINSIINFIQLVLEPTRFTNNIHNYKNILEQINEITIFNSIEIKEDGKFYKTIGVKTLSEAKERINRFKRKLDERNIEKELYKFCNEELINHNYFHAVLEANKCIASIIREKAGIDADGAKLIDGVFGGTSPILRINPLINESQKMEQKGFINLTKGLVMMYRNPTAHAPKVEWKIDEDEAVELFTFASYLIKRIKNSSR